MLLIKKKQNRGNYDINVLAVHTLITIKVGLT